MKKLLTILLVLVCVVSLAACTSKKEAENEKFDINCMSNAEDAAMNAYYKLQDTEPELCAQMAADGVYYDPETESLTLDKPSVGYGKGTSADGGESWGYFCGVEDGKGVVAYYDNSYDYTNCYLHIQYDDASSTCFMNWESIN